MCLVCEKNFSNEAMKPFRLLEHLQKIHSDKSGKTLAFFHSLRDQFLKRKTMNMFTSSSKNSDDSQKAYWNISLLIAKASKPHTIGEELILPAVKEVIKTVLHESPEQVIKSIPLSESSVQRRVYKMAENVGETLSKMLMTTEFSLQLDESTLPGKESLLLPYVRFIKGGSLCQELLFARLLETDTKGESVYRAVEDYFQKKKAFNLQTSSHVQQIAPRGFLSYLKKAVPKVLTVHCVIHRQHLVAKNLSEKLHESLSSVITAVNKIKANALNSRLFHQLCIENDEDFQCLLLHTEVRWLSKGSCLKRFYTLFNSVLDFFQESNPELYDKLKSSKTDIAYLTEMFSKFNEVNLQLRGNETSLIKAKSALSAFLSKLQLYSRNVGRGEFRQFLCLTWRRKQEWRRWHCRVLHSFSGTPQGYVSQIQRPIFSWNPWLGDRSVYWTQHRSANPSRRWTCKFAKWRGSETKVQNLLPSLLDANSDPQTLPNPVERHQVVFHCFSASYLVERGFSAVSRLLIKQRNKLNITERGDLRLLPTNLHPDVDSLIAMHQAHPSH